MADQFNQGLSQAGMAGGQAPTMFEMSLPGLFAQQQLDFEGSTKPGHGWLEDKFPGLFRHSKRKQKLIDDKKIAAHAQLKRSRANVGARFAQASGLSPQAVASGAAESKPLRSALEAAARQEPGGMEALQTMAILGPKGQAGAELSAAQAQKAMVEATGGPLGSNLDVKTFRQINDVVTSQAQGAQDIRAIREIVGTLTDAEIMSIGQGTGGELQGEIKGKLFGLFRPMQQLLDSGEMGSVLRESDVKVIEDALGNPDKMMNLLFSREAKTMATMDAIAGLMDRRASNALRGLDDRTLGLLAPAFEVQPSRFTRPEGDDKPKKKRVFEAPADPGPAAGQTGGGLKSIWEDFIEWEGKDKNWFGPPQE